MDSYDAYWNRGRYNYRPSRAYSYAPYRAYSYGYYDDYDEPYFGRLYDDSYDWYGEFGRFSHTMDYGRQFTLPYNNSPQILRSRSQGMLAGNQQKSKKRAQQNLRYGVDHETADQVCCESGPDRKFVEYKGYAF